MSHDLKTSLNQMKKSSKFKYTHLNYEVLRSHPAIFMKLSPLFMEIWSFETIHCLNFNTQCQKRHDITNDVKGNFLIWGFVGCLKNMLFLANILFFLFLACVQWNSQ